MRIIEIVFDEILPFWKKLWPHMNYITPISPISYKFKIDHKLKNNDVIFLAAIMDRKIVGVNSISQTNKFLWRTRGIWVDPSYRNQKVGSKLLKESEKIALNMKAIYMWSMPRKDAFDFYIKNGFEQRSKWFNEYEFGPHCYIMKELKNE
jgi:GNAT superfamily N-acetyltransferase